MEIKFNVTKEERKALVSAVSELTGWAAVYKGAPSFAFAVNNFVIDKNGTIIYDERAGIDEVRLLLAGLSERGFVFEGGIDGITPSAGTDESASDDTPVDEAPYRLAIEIPLDGFTQTALDNLERLVEGKAALIMKAVGADALPVERTETTLRFPWFQLSSSENETDAYSRFIFALCDMAKRQKRVTLKETDTDSESSEKFAFRCFLLRLGFIGDESKAARKILLSKLSGNASFKVGGYKRSDTQTAVTAAEIGVANGEAVTVREDESGANSAEASGDAAAYAYNPNLSVYDSLMIRGEN